MKKLVILFVLSFGITFLVSAQTTPQVTKRQVRQNVRIADGVASGELTKFEDRNLKKQQRHIQKEKRLAKADGVVTRKERAHIRHDQRVANRSIYKQKHDLQSRN